MEKSPGVEVRYALGHVQRQRHPDRPRQLFLAHLNQLLETSAVDVLKLLKHVEMYARHFSLFDLTSRSRISVEVTIGWNSSFQVEVFSFHPLRGYRIYYTFNSMWNKNEKRNSFSFCGNSLPPKRKMNLSTRFSHVEPPPPTSPPRRDKNSAFWLVACAPRISSAKWV